MKRLLIALTFATVTILTPALAADGTGSFRGASGHVTSGSVIVKTSDGKITIELKNNFSLDGAPDPWVALGKGTRPVGGLIGKLRSNTGSQTYQTTARSGRDKATHVVIWCKRFATPIGVAKID